VSLSSGVGVVVEDDDEEDVEDDDDGGGLVSSLSCDDDVELAEPESRIGWKRDRKEVIELVKESLDELALFLLACIGMMD
jgi:hypothetical protein